jgi:hypothetical protein
VFLLLLWKRSICKEEKLFKFLSEYTKFYFHNFIFLQFEWGSTKIFILTQCEFFHSSSVLTENNYTLCNENSIMTVKDMKNVPTQIPSFYLILYSTFSAVMERFAWRLHNWCWWWWLSKYSRLVVNRS